MAKLVTLITPTSLEELAGTAAFDRGQAYFDDGAVDRLHRADQEITARVMGSDVYRVRLWADGEELGYDCTCPRAADGYFCKHCVAVGLSLLEQHETTSEFGDAAAQRDPLAAIREFLGLQTTDYLIDLLMDQAQRDDALYRGLLLKAENASGSVDLIKSFRKAIDSVMHVRGFVDWREAGGFASDLDQLTGSLKDWLTPDTADALVELTEYAIKRLDGTLEQVDDSDGEVGEVLTRLSELHQRACALAKPDPVALAERLFRYETTYSFEAFYDSAQTYRDVLGSEGLNCFRELAEQQWETIKPLGPEDERRADDSSNRWRITRIMETLARMSDDINALVAIKARDLSLPYHYLSIAEIYRDANQPERALEWAERGLQAFPKRPDNRLRDFLVGAYLERGRNDEALQLTWIQFDERPGLEHYRKLHDVATALRSWQNQRRRALDLIETRAVGDANEITRWRPKPSQPDRSLRVEIALWENDIDSAWEATQHSTCRRELLLSLAGRLEAPRPADALTIYRRVVPTVIEETNNRAYEEAVRQLGKVGALMQTLGATAEFALYLGSLRTQYKQKRNFIKLLDSLSQWTAVR